MTVDVIDTGHRRHAFAVGFLLARKAAGHLLGTGLGLCAGRLTQGLFSHHHPLAIKGQHLNRLGLGRLLELRWTGLDIKGVKVLGRPVDDLLDLRLPRRTLVSVSMSRATASKDSLAALAATRFC